ncbi:DNA polymerase alpha catalytic subunit-like isoform X3 [Temnothorax longispinosus]|uniref:DNA polymerase alpha catalytic subunit-like isoform X3 n=1 Tax=Temnothorax longispinosus TaxID=300112 RepID=UPI003A98EC90
MTKTLFYSQILMGKIIFNQGFVGRPICDIQVSVKELNLKVRSYDLQSLCSAVLKMKEHECKEITSAETPSFFNTVDKVLNLMHVTLKEAKYIMTIVMDLNVISLALQIICLAGNILSRTLLGRRAERNEYACNNRYSFNLGKLGLLMDFNFWYCTRCINPSIIQEYNLCFTIVPSAAYADVQQLNILELNLESGMIPTEIHKLVKSRQQIKQLMKAPNLLPEQKMDYHVSPL